jgi:uncharacterized protein (DUF58 family)
MNPLAQYLNPQVIQEVGRLDLRARFIVEGFLAGLHRSPFAGFSVEFSEHRKYVPGDEPRTIDWKVFGRTDRLYVRKYEAETHLACHLLVDASASMGYVGYVGAGAVPASDQPGTPWPQPAAKLMYTIHLAAALGYLLTRQRDTVGLGIITDHLVQMLPARARRAHLVNLLAALSNTVPQGQTGLARGAHEALAHIPHRGLIVFLSDLLTDTDAVLEAFHHIRFRGHDLIVMHVLDAAETSFPFDGAVRLEDPETGITLTGDADALAQRYRSAVATWRADLRTRIQAVQADYVPLDTSVPFDRALVEFLIQRQRRR